MGRAAGRLDYDGVSFSYDGARKVLDGINVHIRPGEVVGLVGPSGAGKTTFASLLPRFYDVSSGTLRVDGVDVRDASLHDVRKNIAFVSQHPVLFHGTIMENIRLGRQDAADDEVVAAAPQLRTALSWACRTATRPCLATEEAGCPEASGSV